MIICELQYQYRNSASWFRLLSSGRAVFESIIMVFRRRIYSKVHKCYLLKLCDNETKRVFRIFDPWFPEYPRMCFQYSRKFYHYPDFVAICAGLVLRSKHLENVQMFNLLFSMLNFQWMANYWLIYCLLQFIRFGIAERQK